MASERDNPATPKVICLGLGRTGTTSLREALEILGFGPCYHMSTIMKGGGKDFPIWCKIGDGQGTPEDLDGLLRGYNSIAGYPSVMYPAELYAAYPNAKFILTTRDPARWEKSIHATILPSMKSLKEKSEKNEYQENMSYWNDTYMQNKYHGGRLSTNAQQELIDHIDRVKRCIPAEKLLVFEVREGWDKLVEFLGVPKPVVPFPHLNDEEQFKALIKNSLGINMDQGKSGDTLSTVQSVVQVNGFGHSGK